MFVIHFFDCNVSNRIYSLCFYQTIRRPVLFTWKLITFNSNWSINWAGETIVDTALDVSENSHSNAYSEVLSKVVAY